MLPAKGMGKAFPELLSPLTSLQYFPPGFPGMDHQQLPTGFRLAGSLSPGPSLGAREALSLTTLLSQNSEPIHTVIDYCLFPLLERKILRLREGILTVLFTLYPQHLAWDLTE